MGDARLYATETRLQMCIRMEITIFSFVEVYRRLYGRKSRFTAPLARRRKTKEFLAIRRAISLNETFVLFC